MHATISKWGNSLALRLPRNLAEEVHLSEGASVDLVVEDGALKITPSRKKFKLSDLLAEEPRASEVDWGKSKGDEAW
jgi:antitoxin MazE